MPYSTLRYFFTVVLCFSVLYVAAQPVASFTATPMSGCSPLFVSFNNTSTGATSYSWNLGNGNTSLFTNATATYNGAGIYNVSLTATSGTGSSAQSNTYIVQIYVYDPPTVNFYATPTTVCLGQPITFYDQSTLNAPGAGNYVWNFGNGQSQTGTPATYVYPASGPYSVTLVVTNGQGCVSSNTMNNYITVNAQPIAAFSASTTLTCTNVPVTFNNFSTGTGSLNYTWSFGDNSPNSNATSPTHSYTSPGTYTVTLYVVDAAGCSDTLSSTNYISVIPGTVANFTGPASICAGQTATFTNTSTPGFTSCSWDFGDGNTGSGSPASNTYATANTYQVTLTSTNNNCSSSVVKPIVINALPATNVSFAPTLPCPGAGIISFSTTTPGTSYTWTFGDGSSPSNVQNPTHTYTTDDSFTVTLAITNSLGCTDTGTYPYLVKVLPLTHWLWDSMGNGCVPFQVCFHDSAVYDSYNVVTSQTETFQYPSPITSWTWDFGDGSVVSHAAKPCHTYTVYGTYTATSTIVTANGCTKTDTIIIHAGSPDTANFTASPLVACVKTNIYFTNLSTGATNYYWSFGDGVVDSVNAPNPQISYQYHIPGVYTIILIAVNNGCGDTLIKPFYITIHNPKAQFGPQYSCTNNDSVTFNNTSIGVSSFSWNFGDGSPLDNTHYNPSHFYATNGTYPVVLTVHNDTFNCTDSTLANIIISQPIASITTPDTAVCKGSPIVLTGLLGGGAPPPATSAYGWTIDNIQYPDSIYLKTHVFQSIGQKPVTLVILDYRGCHDTAHKTLLVAWPSVNFSASPTQVCLQSPVLFTDQTSDAVTTTFTSRTWEFGDGGTINGNNSSTSHSYSNPGTYNVVLYVTDNVGCTDSLLKPAYVQVHKPEADFTVANTTVCKKSDVQFYNLSQGVGLTYQWYFGDGGTSSTPMPVYAYQAAGVYTVKLVVTDNIGCKDSLVLSNYVTVEDDPIASFSLTDTFSICSPVTDTFTNTTVGGNTYLWYFGDGNASGLQNAVNVYNTAGQYTVQMIATNSYGCKDTAYAHVQVLGYSGLITYTPLTGCVPLTVTFTANISMVPSFVFDFSDGSTFSTTSTTATHTYTTPGAYVPRLILNSAQGCQSYSVGNDVIKADGVYAGFTYAPAPACGNDSVHFNDTSHAAFSSITSTEWIFEDGSTNASLTPIHYYTPGTYNVILTEVTSTGCLDTVRTTLSVFNIPSITACPDTIVCLGDSASLYASGGVSYTWAPAATLSCTNCATPYANPVAQTSYVVSGTDANGCVNTDTTVVSLKLKASGTADSLGAICRNDTLQLHSQADYSGATYTWIPPGGLSDSHSADPGASPGSTVNYMLIISEGRCIPDTLYSTVIVHPLPTVSTGPDQTIIAGNSTTIYTTATNTISYLWTPDSALNCDTCANPTSTPTHSTEYKVSVVSDFGCVDTATIRIKVICDHSQVFIPNTFTPNGDGANDHFYPHGKGLQIIKSFRIYDRWGEMVYQKQNFNLNEIDNSWDGTYNGKKLTPDVYVYVVDAICETGSPITWNGDVALIR